MHSLIKMRFKCFTDYHSYFTKNFLKMFERHLNKEEEQKDFEIRTSKIQLNKYFYLKLLC